MQPPSCHGSSKLCLAINRLTVCGNFHDMFFSVRCTGRNNIVPYLTLYSFQTRIIYSTITYHNIYDKL